MGYLPIKLGDIMANTRSFIQHEMEIDVFHVFNKQKTDIFRLYPTPVLVGAYYLLIHKVRVKFLIGLPINDTCTVTGEHKRCQ